MRVGLGMAALGRPGYINLHRDKHLSSRTVDDMRETAHKVIDELFRRCRELNNAGTTDLKLVPWLDCARSYGLSEEFVGDYLRRNNISPEDVYVSSKWGYIYVANWNVELDEGESHEIKDHSLENFMKQVEETKSHIGPYVNLYQVHSATFDSGVLTNTRLHEALHRICRVDNGWSIGLSVSGPNQGDVIREALKLHVPICDDNDTNSQQQQQTQQRLFDSVQCTYNILEQRPHEALIDAHKAGMDIIIKEGLANGRALLHPKLIQISHEMDCKPDQLALGAILSQPFHPRVLSGAVSVEQLGSNISSLDVQEILSSTNAGQTYLHRLMCECSMESEAYWKDRSALKWN